jgi:beta-glucosidase
MTERPPPWWGTGAAATQCEGAALRSDWAGWETEGRVPPSRDGNGFRTRHAEDFGLLAQHGITHHRLTIEWARLEPAEGRWSDDEEAHLRGVLAAARDAGVAVWACLLHGSAPGWFTDDRRGWLDDKAASLTWPRHVDRVAEALGDLVAGWVPIHEPDLQARLGYGEGTFPPGRRNDDDERDARVALRAAEAEAARLLQGGGAPVALAARIGAAVDGTPAPAGGTGLVVVSAPVDGLETALERATEEAPDAAILVVTGDPPGADTDPGPSGGTEPSARPGRVGIPASSAAEAPGGAAGEGDAPGAEPSSLERRVERLLRAVAVVADAHRGGTRVVGAFHLPAIDGYEWHRGFEARLGLFDRDRAPRPVLAALPRPAHLPQQRFADAPDPPRGS